MDLPTNILQIIGSVGKINSVDLAKTLNVDHSHVIGGINCLESLGDVITCEHVSKGVLQLTEEGENIVKSGSYEHNLFMKIPNEDVSQKYLMDCPNFKVALSKALAYKWIAISKDASGESIVRKLVPEVIDKTRNDLESVHSSPSCLDVATIAELKKRKLLAEVKQTSFNVGKGKGFVTTLQKEEKDLSPEMLLSSSWRTAKFKEYNFNALGATLASGHLHPLLRVRAELCKILRDMGFSEMPTNAYVECSFWNFDSLFQPQQHPARDAQDTFFLSDPASTDLSRSVPAAYIDQVRTVHSQGAFGSHGYRSDWLPGEAEKNLLRTHTTAVSARMLYALANQAVVKPTRLFSIDRVFRNENLDATHLAEFHQVEGLVVDHGIGLGHLKAVIRAFFQRLGLRQLRFKPAYNPYTEPSMEIFSYHPGLGKWIEIGNSGIFRPEMLRPMGLPEGLNVIAWGLSLERPTMIRYGYKNIRDLIGPKIDLAMVENAPLSRLTV